MTEPILRLDSLDKRFGDAVAARDFSLDVHAGEFFTFLGPSGSGKSSVLRMIAGLESPDSGRVVIDGRDVSGVPPWERGIGMVFQSYAVFPHMNVEENVGYGLRMRRRPKAQVRERVSDLLGLVGLAGTEDRDVVTLSGGEQQRIALARALALAPPILLLDEPLSALDEKIRREMQTELKRIQKQTGTTFVYVTHDQEEALTMSDRIAVIDRGACVQCDTPRTLFRRPLTRFVAGFFRDCNLLEAQCIGIDGERARLRVAGTPVEIALAGRQPRQRDRAAVAIRAESPVLGDRAERCPVVLDARLLEVQSIEAPASSMSASSPTASASSPFRPARRSRPGRGRSVSGWIPRASCCWRTDRAAAPGSTTSWASSGACRSRSSRTTSWCRWTPPGSRTGPDTRTSRSTSLTTRQDSSSQAGRARST